MDTRKKVASSTTNLHQDRGKDTNKIPQFKRLAQCFSEMPKTMYQAERETGIRIANIGGAKRNAHNLDGRGDDVLLCFTAS